MTYASKIVDFLKHIELNYSLPEGIHAMNPYRDNTIFEYCRKFYHRYYNNSIQRTMVIGINPGRFGGGLTGIPFTDPIKLEKECGIDNDLPKRAELSGDFIYKMIHAWGNVHSFYDRFYFSSISILGFVCNGKNMNYYDNKELQKVVYPFIVQTIQKQLQFGLNTHVVYCLGEGKNTQFLMALNKQHQFFKKIIPLPHPRFIMQYRRKKVDRYIQTYIEQLSLANHF